MGFAGRALGLSSSNCPTSGQINLPKLPLTPLLNGDENNPNDFVGFLEASDEIIQRAWFIL